MEQCYAPIIADIDDDGYDDIIVIDTVFSLPYSINQNNFGSNKITLKNNIYAYSEQNHQRLFRISGTK